MTSRSLFWARSRENHRRRVWVWIVAVLSQLLAYGAMITIYLSRIRIQNENGVYKTAQEFQQAMYQAARDALAFQHRLWLVILFLGAVIGMQGFSYLYDRRKVDLYHSVPVSRKQRFGVIYVNGIMIYLTANLAGLVTGTVIAAAQGAVNGSVLAYEGLGFVWNFLLFLTTYHIMLLALMLTGNRFVTLCVFGAMMYYEEVIYWVFDGMKWNFFKTASIFYLSEEKRLTPWVEYMNHIYELKAAETVAQAAGICLPMCGKWLVTGAVILALVYLCYIKRQSEAAGKAIVYNAVKPVLKIAVVIPAALVVGITVYGTSYNNELLMVLAILAAGVIFSAAMEVLYDFDIRSAFRHLLSGGIALAGLLAVFCIYKWDLTGYDSYIPAENKVESVAISLNGYYDNYWDKQFRYISEATFQKEHMFLTDAAPVLALVEKSQQTDWETMEDGRRVEILYRLKSGRQVGRVIQADYADAETEELLNRIMGTDAYRRGRFQLYEEGVRAESLMGVTYSNGAVQVAVPLEAAGKLREAWLKDLEHYDFSLERHSNPCGILSLKYKGYMLQEMRIYETFTNTIACLQSMEAYYPVQLDASDVESVTVTNYHNELSEQMKYDGVMTSGVRPTARPAAVLDAEATDVDYTVRETFYEEKQIAEILKHVHPSRMLSDMAGISDREQSYSVEVVFKKNTEYPYDREAYYFNYTFLAGQVPEFVAEATAYRGQEE